MKKVLKKESVSKDDQYNIKPFESWVWKKYDLEQIVDFKDFIRSNKRKLFFVGTDSQQRPKYRSCIFSSVLVAWDYDELAGCGHGATAIRTHDKKKIFPIEAISSRLMSEVLRSIEICKALEEELLEISLEEGFDYTGNFKGVTIDVNQSPMYKSGKYKDALVGMVMSYGWNVLIKPDNMTASKVADRKC